MSEDYKGISDQLSLRSNDRLEKYFKNSTQLNATFLLAQSDIGVCRNGGRRGSKYAPEAILNVLKKFADHFSEATSFSQAKVINHAFDLDFNTSQNEEYKNIKHELSKKNCHRYFHLGGGHDHIYPFLKAIEHDHDKILVVNIDAHLDTRVDPIFHSGTPFRQFANETKKEFKLIQLGIHDFANAKSNYDVLKNGNMEVYEQDLIREWTNNFTEPIEKYLDALVENYQDHTFVLSLDCDALASDIMDAVSAVNHRGLPAHTVNQIFAWYKKRNQDIHYYGIYEYNPVYDNLSQKGARYLAALIHDCLN